MTLALSKLQDLLIANRFLPTKYFIMDGACFYIELMSLHNGEVVLLYIPSKYNFEVRSDDEVRGCPIYKIKYINMSDDRRSQYDQVGYGERVELPPEEDKVAEHLENHYKEGIALKDISDDDSHVLRAIYRQIKRLRYCVQTVKYKLGIQFRNYLCAIRRDDSVDCFQYKNYPRDNIGKKMLIIIDLETFYAKKDQLLEDLTTVRTSIYHVLEKNQGVHNRVLQKLAENRREMVMIPMKCEQKSGEYDRILAELQEMLGIMLESEKKILDELEKMTADNKPGLASDIDRVHRKSRLDKELDKINTIRSDIAKEMNLIRTKRDNTVLSVDNIFFDNAAMFGEMIKNFAELKELC